MSITKQSSFDRTLYNQAAMGAYYTDPWHCRLIHRLLQFPEGEEVAVLEPSIGDGTAVSLVTGKADNPNVRIFGIELNRETCEKLKGSPNVDYLLNADFTTGIRATNGVFSFCFGNPPYGQELTGAERLERTFLRKATDYLAPGAILCWVIPTHLFGEDEHYAAILTRRYQIHGVYRFHEPEFSKWKQIVIIARKKAKSFDDPEEALRLMETLDNLPLLPTEDESVMPIAINPSADKEVRLFEARAFDPEEAQAALKRGRLNDVFLKQNRHVSAGELGRPPLMPKKDHLYLLSVAGYSDGLVGDEASGDLHLQRGRIIRSSSVSCEVDEDGKVTERKREFSKSIVTIIENDGRITELGDDNKKN